MEWCGWLSRFSFDWCTKTSKKESAHVTLNWRARNGAPNVWSLASHWNSRHRDNWFALIAMPLWWPEIQTENNVAKTSQHAVCLRVLWFSRWQLNKRQKNDGRRIENVIVELGRECLGGMMRISSRHLRKRSPDLCSQQYMTVHLSLLSVFFASEKKLSHFGSYTTFLFASLTIQAHMYRYCSLYMCLFRCALHVPMQFIYTLPKRWNIEYPNIWRQQAYVCSGVL